jgi:hypothetical protein
VLAEGLVVPSVMRAPIDDAAAEPDVERKV